MKREWCWLVATIESRTVEHDYRSSGQGRPTGRALFAGDECLLNACESVEPAIRATQVDICTECGISGCGAGGWIAMRRVDDAVAWVPAFDLWSQDDTYRPPPWMKARGAALFLPEAWQSVIASRRGWPGVEAMPHLDTREAVGLLQLTAPGGILGRMPDPPELERGALLAVTSGDVRLASSSLQRMLRDWSAKPRDLVLRHVMAAAWEVYVDRPGVPEWSALAWTDDGPCLRLPRQLDRDRLSAAVLGVSEVIDDASTPA